MQYYVYLNIICFLFIGVQSIHTQDIELIITTKSTITNIIIILILMSKSFALNLILFLEKLNALY